MSNKKRSPKVIAMFSLKRFLKNQAIQKAGKLQFRQAKRNAKLELEAAKHKKHNHEEHFDLNADQIEVIDTDNEPT